jgi:hypothetical protein
MWLLASMIEDPEQPPLDAIRVLFLKVNDFVREEQDLLDEELARMSKLVQEAVANLHDSFNAMGDRIVEQSAELRTRSARTAGTEVSKKMNALLSSTQQINSMVVRAVISLQFEDIVQQLILHSRQRIAEIQRLMLALRAYVDKMAPAHAGDPQWLLDMVGACHEEVSKTKKALTLSHPAKQESLDKGDVTLF